MLASALLLIAVCAAAPAPDDATPPVGAAPCIACRAPALDPETLFSTDDWVALRKGEVLRENSATERSDTELEGASRAESLIPRPPAQVWSVLTDFERWPEFMPLIDETKIARRAGPRLWVAQEYSVLLVSLGHTTIYELEPSVGRLLWKLDQASPHDIEASRGAWALIPLDSGRETLVRYDAVMSAGRAVPGFVERMLRERSLEQLLSSLRAEVLLRYPEN